MFRRHTPLGTPFAVIVFEIGLKTARNLDFASLVLLGFDIDPKPWPGVGRRFRPPGRFETIPGGMDMCAS